MAGDEWRGDAFRKLLEVQEKSVEAWSRVYNKLDELIRAMDWVGQEFKDSNNLLRTRPCVTESVPYASFENHVRNEMENFCTSNSELYDKISGIEKMLGELIKREKDFKLWISVVTAIIVFMTTVMTLIVAVLSYGKK